MHTPHGGVSRIIVIRFSSAGDIVLASPLLRALRSHFPGVTIDFLTLEEYAPLVRFSPYINTVHAARRSWGYKDLVAHAAGIVSNSGRYDVAIDIHASLRSRIVRRHLAPRVLRIHKPTIRKRLLTVFGVNLLRPIRAIPLRYLDVVRPLAVAYDGRGLELFCNGVTSPIVKSLESPVTILAPGARHFTKAWPVERFAELARRLVESGDKVILLGGPDERDLCDELTVLSGVAHGIVNLAGRTSFLEAAATMDLARCVVANDSALTHIAVARGRPTVALFGSTVREFGFAPFDEGSIVVERDDVPCRPCTTIGRSDCPKGHFDCMRRISVDDVMAAFHKVRDTN